MPPKTGLGKLFSSAMENYGPAPFLQGALGIGQTIGGLIGQAKGRKEVKNLLATRPQAKVSEGILSYYNQSLQRAGISPTQTSMYKRQMQNIGRSATAGLRSAQDRRSGLASSSSIARGMSDAALGAEVAAEGQQERRFAQRGAAAQALAGEERRVFDINEMQPFETRMGMAMQRTAGGAKTANIGLSNIFGAGKSMSRMQSYKKYGRNTYDGDDTGSV